MLSWPLRFNRDETDAVRVLLDEWGREIYALRNALLAESRLTRPQSRKPCLEELDVP